jgi:hypothetical protein
VELEQALNDVTPPRTLAQEWNATAAAVSTSKSRLLKLIFVEVPHVVRAILGFPKAVVASTLRILLIGLRIFIRAKAGGDAEPDAQPTPAASPLSDPGAGGPAPDAPAARRPVGASDDEVADAGDASPEFIPPENLVNHPANPVN